MAQGIIISWLELGLAATGQIGIVVALFWRQSILIAGMKSDQAQFRKELTEFKAEIEAGKQRENQLTQKLDRANLLLEMIYKKVYDSDAPR